MTGSGQPEQRFSDGGAHGHVGCEARARTATSLASLNTGQRLCYDARGGVVSCPGSGQDAEVATVRDGLTGLEWARSADLLGKLTTWEEALHAVGKLDRWPPGTEGGWRLPTINELESLVDARTHDPALPRGHPFERPQEAYWSSTTSAYEPDWSMALYLDKGAVGVGMKKGRYFSVWPVRRTRTPVVG